MALIDRVHQLIEAENKGDRLAADTILAPDFVAITRRGGGEEDRTLLLSKIGNPPVANPIRVVDDCVAWESSDVGVVRSRVQTLDPATRAVTGVFRNVHIFTKERDAWMCVDWQVTELTSTPAPKDPLAVASAYEEGKHRRYGLLFAVNGGAFTVAGLVAGADAVPVMARLQVEHLAVGMALFTTAMAVDIDAFGRRMKQQAAVLYQPVGVAVLLSIGLLLVAGWMMAAFALPTVAVALASYLAVVGSAHAFKW